LRSIKEQPHFIFCQGLNLDPFVPPQLQTFGDADHGVHRDQFFVQGEGQRAADYIFDEIYRASG
jgi:hypothetical protein